MARRRYGSGGVKQRADGRWEGRLWLADGTRRSIYARSRERLVSRLQEERWRLAWGIPVRARGLLLGDYLRQWIVGQQAHLRPSTHRSYKMNIEAHVLPRIGAQ